MTVESPPIFLQAGSHGAEQVRRALATMMGNRGGILTPTDLAVTEKSGTANMSVDVATGQVGIVGGEATYQGIYLCENRGTLNVVIAAADATNPRRDLIVARVRDSAYSGATNTFTIEVATGTPAGSPADPALPSGSVFVLARVDVDASASSITNADITDLRTSYDSSQYGLLTAAGGTIICTSSTRPASPYEGMSIYETDTDRKLTYSGAAWVQTDQLSTWPTYTPTITQGVTVSKTISYARYLREGRKITVEVLLLITSSGTSGQTLSVSLPVTAAQGGAMVSGTMHIYNGSSNNISAAALRTTTDISFLATGGYYTTAVASGMSVSFLSIYEAAS